MLNLLCSKDIKDIALGCKLACKLKINEPPQELASFQEEWSKIQEELNSIAGFCQDETLQDDMRDVIQEFIKDFSKNFEVIKLGINTKLRTSFTPISALEIETFVLHADYKIDKPVTSTFSILLASGQIEDAQAYIFNLNDKKQKEELQKELYTKVGVKNYSQITSERFYLIASQMLLDKKIELTDTLLNNHIYQVENQTSISLAEDTRLELAMKIAKLIKKESLRENVIKRLQKKITAR